MNNLLKIIVLLSVLTLISCNQSQIERLQTELEDAVNKISNIEDRVSELESAIED